MQLITKVDLIELANSELQKLPEYDDSILINDVKQVGHVFVFRTDNTQKFSLASELLTKIDPLFAGKFKLID